MKRIILLTALAGLVLLTAGGCSMLGDRIKKHLEMVGSELTGTEVTVEAVDIKPARGAGSIEHLRVANLDGYVARNALSIGSLDVNIGLVSTIAGEPIKIDSLLLAYPVVNFEKDRSGRSNLSQLFEQVQQRREAADTKSAELEPGSKDEPGKPIRLKIKELRIEGITLNVLRENGDSRSAVLPTIVMEDVGGDDGATPARLGLIIAGAMTGEILKQAIAQELIERAGDIKQALSPENLMALLEYKLHLTPQLEDLIRPVVDDFSNALRATIDNGVDKEHIDLAELEEQFLPIFEQYRQRIEKILDQEAFAAFKAQLPEIRDNAVEVLRYLIITRIAGRLEMTPEQLAELMPVLHEYLRQVSDLISNFVAEPEASKSLFIASYEVIDQRVHDRLAERLSAEQMERYRDLREELLEKIEVAADQVR